MADCPCTEVTGTGQIKIDEYNISPGKTKELVFDSSSLNYYSTVYQKTAVVSPVRGPERTADKGKEQKNRRFTQSSLSGAISFFYTAVCVIETRSGIEAQTGRHNERRNA
jgi:hypothetical protein